VLFDDVAWTWPAARTPTEYRYHKKDWGEEAAFFSIWGTPFACIGSRGAATPRRRHALSGCGDGGVVGGSHDIGSPAPRLAVAF